MTEPKHENEIQISQNITFESFQESIKDIDNLKDLRAFKKDFYSRGTKILKNGNKPIFEKFTEKKKGEISKPLDPNFSKYDTSEEFLDPDGSIIKKFFDDREAELIAIEDLENEEKANEQKQIDSTKDEEEINEDDVALEKIIDEALYPGVADLAQDTIAKRHAQKVESTISTESMSEPATKLESEGIKAEETITKELSEENIRNAKNLKELSLILVNSDGIESDSQGHFSGADLSFLIERVAKGEAYIEEITRQHGLRETVWNLIKNEKGSEPKSLEHEEEQAVRERLKAAAAEPKIVEAKIPEPELPSHPPAPKDTQKHIIPLTPAPEKKSAWGGIKKFFGFGKK